MSDVPVTAAWMMCLWLSRAGQSPHASIGRGSRLRPGDPDPAQPRAAGRSCRSSWCATPRYVRAAGGVAGVCAWRSFSGIVVRIAAALRLRRRPTSCSRSPTSPANVPRYFNWLITTAPILLRCGLRLLAAAAGSHGAGARWPSPRSSSRRTSFTRVFDDWSYLRFLLPALAVLAVFTAVELSAWIRRWPAGATRAGAVCAGAGGDGRTASGRRARSRPSSWPSNCGAWPWSATTSTPQIAPSAVILAGEQSGVDALLHGSPDSALGSGDARIAAPRRSPRSSSPGVRSTSSSTDGSMNRSAPSSPRCPWARSTGRRCSTPAPPTARACGNSTIASGSCAESS